MDEFKRESDAEAQYNSFFEESSSEASTQEDDEWCGGEGGGDNCQTSLPV